MSGNNWTVNREVSAVKLLMTGFSPFGGESMNPAWEAVRRLPDRLGEWTLVKREIPTSFAGCAAALEGACREHRPDAVLCVGQAGGRACVTVERVAVNLAEASIPDNDGAQPVDQPLVPGGPAAYFATLPVKAMVRRVRAAGVPCQLSYTAGTYVCNCAMYRALHLAAEAYPGMRAGFIHVPYTPRQALDKPGATPTMSLEDISRALAAAAEAIAEGREDSGANMGTTH